MLKQIFIGLIIGFFATIFIMQDDVWFKNTLQHHAVAMLENMSKCSVQARIHSLQFFSPSVELCDVIVKPYRGDTSWYWQAKKAKVDCSWWHFFCFGSFDMHLVLEDITLYSEFRDGDCAVMQHLKKLYGREDRSYAFFLKDLECKRAHVQLVDTSTESKAHIFFTSITKKITKFFKSSVHIHDGSLIIKGKEYIPHVHGKMLSEACASPDGIYITAQSDGSGTGILFDHHEDDFLFWCEWSGQKGMFTIKKSDESFIINPASLQIHDNGFSVHMNVRAPVVDIYKLYYHTAPQVDIDGRIQADIAITQQSGDLQIESALQLEDFKVNSVGLCTKAVVNGARQRGIWHGSIACTPRDGEIFEGSWHWHEDIGTGAVTVRNTEPFYIPYTHHWKIPSEGSGVTITLNGDGIIRTNYNTTIINEKTDESVAHAGVCSLDKQHVVCQGTFNGFTYTIHGNVQKPPYVTHCSIYNDTKSCLLLLNQSEKPNILQGSMAVDLLRKACMARWNYDLQGEGNFAVSMNLAPVPTVHLQLNKGNIRLPHTYNFVNGLQAEIQWDRSAVRVKDLMCALYRGSVTAEQLVLFFDDEYHISFVHAPLLLNKCLLNFNKDLFAVVSGRITVSKHSNPLPLLKGTLFIDHAQLQENIFSHEFQKNILKMGGRPFDVQDTDMLCDIAVETVSPIAIKTDFLETQAKVSLRAQSSIRRPDISGCITLQSGTMSFPYKPLFITKGTLYFMPQQPADPLLEIIAKNTIKKHMITLTMNGSVNKPQTMLESSPPLTEEQIISLLLLGSQEESLNIVMPALIMQNITNLIFGDNNSALKLDRYFKSLLKPFKSVHLVPSFTDQTGRGGLRGALEIDINERWRALIQKNFNLSEDTRFELEHMISDDISVRGFRDERRDIGGEVEVKFKF